jgi:uncharacterized repeat protein (TIGR03803 family)
MRHVLLLLSIALLCFDSLDAHAAPGVRVAHSFSASMVRPSGPLVQAADGAFYGTTAEGGGDNAGTIFRMQPDGTLTIVHAFLGRAEGRNPLGLTLGFDGTLYGLTREGGVLDGGTIYRVTATGRFSLLHAFDANSTTGLRYPVGQLTLTTTGDFYGLTGAGRAFRMTPAGMVTSLAGPGYPLYGQDTPLIQARDGLLYGVTSGQGGVAYRMGLDGVSTVLHQFPSFSGTAFSPSRSGLLQTSNGNLYGVSRESQSTAAVLYRLTTSGEFSVRGEIPGGGSPSGTLIEFFDNFMCGVTTDGGAFGKGSMYCIDLNGSGAVWHSFDGVDGRRPAFGLFLSGNRQLFGTTAGFDPAADGYLPSTAGTAFQYDWGGASGFHLLATFAASAEGAGAIDRLVPIDDGSFVGATRYGGQFNGGTVFRFTPGGTSTLYSFANATLPNGVVRTRSGDLYGTSRRGRDHPYGDVFRLTPGGTFTSVFGVPYESYPPLAAPVEASDGNLYFGLSAYGEILRMTPAGSAVTIANLGPSSPEAPLIQGRDGALYGTTKHKWSTPQNVGTVFRLDLDGSLSTLHTFAGSDDGAYPYGGTLLQASDGNLYGVTAGKWVSGPGWATTGHRSTLFRISPTGGNYAVMHLFDPASDGDEAIGGLVEGPEGNLYGTTASGGAFGYGTLFVMSRGGSFSVLHHFTGGPDGGVPEGTLIRAADNRIYGLTTLGGNGSGVIFVLDPAAPRLSDQPTRTRGSDGRITFRAAVDAYPLPTYRWQIAIGNGPWADLADDEMYAGSRSSSLVVSNPSRVSPAARYRVVVTNAYGATTSAFAPLRLTETVNDLDGDGRSDLGVYRPATGEWFLRQSHSGFAIDDHRQFQWGLAGDLPASADFDGDDRLDPAVYRPSTGDWFIRYSSLDFAVGAGNWTFAWGGQGLVPFARDFDGDGRADLAVYQPSTGVWSLRNSAAGYVPGAGQWTFQWGIAGDIPVAADFDGDGRCDIAVYRPATGEWFIRTSSSGYDAGQGLWFQWGLAGDTPLAADFDNDGAADIAVYRPATGEWFIRYSSAGYAAGTAGWYQWGLAGDQPVLTDPDGDGRTDLVVYRPSSGEWFVRFSSAGYDPGRGGYFQWGLAGDVPLPSREPVGPSDVSVSTTAAMTVRLTWTAVPGATSYIVKRGRVAGAEEVVAAGITSTSYVALVPGGGRHYFVVRALFGTTESVDSMEVSIRVTSTAVRSDFDGDGKSDLIVYRPSSGEWFVRTSSSAYANSVVYQWGQADDTPQPGDFDADGRVDLVVRRPLYGRWFIRYSSLGYDTNAASELLYFGSSAYIPVARDYDGDGKADVALFYPRPGIEYPDIPNWFISTAEHSRVAWGVGSDIPQPADYDGDGKADVAVYRPSSGEWRILLSTTGYARDRPRLVQWGLVGDQPVAADFDGDLMTDLAVYRPSTGEWFVLYSRAAFDPAQAGWFQWGLPGDRPVLGDYDGDGRTDVTVYRPSSGEWFIRYSSSGYDTSRGGYFQWGLVGDIPLPQ